MSFNQNGKKFQGKYPIRGRRMIWVYKVALNTSKEALGKVKCLFDCSQFEFDWKLDPF